MRETHRQHHGKQSERKEIQATNIEDCQWTATAAAANYMVLKFDVQIIERSNDEKLDKEGKIFLENMYGHSPKQ